MSDAPTDLEEKRADPDIVGDGKDRVLGKQRDGQIGASELLKVVLIGIPTLVAVWFLMILLGLA
ncbi:MAG: hypothetical protein AAF645_05155 [Myxococcota bacterium]